MKKQEKEEKGDYHRCEISQGSFSRTIPLPAEVDEANAKASMTDELTLPKLEKSKPHHLHLLIPVRAPGSIVVGELCRDGETERSLGSSGSRRSLGGARANNRRAARGPYRQADHQQRPAKMP